jgi:hypothetical protein
MLGELAPGPKTDKPAKKAALPKVRLIGFVGVGEMKALLSINDETNIAKTGDSLEGLEIVAIDPPKVTMEFDGEELSVDLLHQPKLVRGSGSRAAGSSPSSRTTPAATTSGPAGRVAPRSKPSLPSLQLPKLPSLTTADAKPDALPQLPAVNGTRDGEASASAGSQSPPLPGLAGDGNTPATLPLPTSL